MEYGSVRTPPRLTLRRGPDGEWDDDDEKADGRCRRCWRDRRRWRQWGGAATAACPLLRCGNQRGGGAGDRDVEAEGATPPRVASAWAAKEKREERVLWLQRCSSGVWIVLFFLAPLATFFIGRRRLVPLPSLHPTQFPRSSD